MAINKIAIVFFILPVTLLGQDRYFVSFKDKVNSPFSVSKPLQFLSQKSIDRRTRENFISDTGELATLDDIPVDTAYIHKVKATGASVFYSSRWFNGILVQTDAATVTTITALTFVANVELVAHGTKLDGRQSAKQKIETIMQTTDLMDQFQLQSIGLDQMHAAGYHGEGVDIAVLDGGFTSVNTLAGFQPLFSEGRVKSVFNFVNNTNDIYSAATHGTSTLSILAANIAGTYLGGAYKANYYLYQTEDVSSEYRIEEYNWTFAAERADSAGVDVISSSLGYNQFDDPAMNYTYANMDGKTTVVSRAARNAVLRGILVVNSAGNEGTDQWQYILAPADAEGVIATGAVDASGKKANFSSVGPSADGRIKPDVSALGVNSLIFGSSGCCSTGSGTSFSCPLVAGLVADYRQMFPQASSKDIYNRLIQSSSQIAHPDNMLGYGIPGYQVTEIEPGANDEFELYPNPVKEGSLKILFRNPHYQSFNVTLFNSSGLKVMDISASASESENPYSVNLAQYAPGLYLVKIQTPTSSKTIRIVRIN